jgi:regulator of sigma E protease
MAGEYIGEALSGDPNEFLSRPRYQRVLVMLAGPAMNLLLAVALVAANYMMGIETPTFYHDPATAGFILEGSPAESAGLKVGDRIVALGGRPVNDWADFQMLAISFSKQTVSLRYQRDGRTGDVTVALEETLQDPSEITGILPLIPTRIASVAAGFPAQRIGLAPGDEILEVSDGQYTAKGYMDISRLIQRSLGRDLALTVRRGDDLLTLDCQPAVSKDEPRRGVLGFTITIDRLEERYGLLESLRRSLKDNYNFVVMTYRVLGKVVSGRLSMRQLSGPLGIAEASGEAVKTLKITVVFSFIALISVNLAVINLLPIPLLDGGMIFLLLVEMVIRRDLPTRFKERAIQIGFILLAILMGVVIMLDILKALG